MTSTMHPLDPAAIAGLKKGDEFAFERLFHERYAAMLEVASGYVSDPARAARIVENTLLGLWEGRDQIESAEAAEAWLEQRLHDASVREKGRLAGLHRFTEHEGVQTHRAAHDAPTVEAAWKEVSERMHGKLRDPNVAAHIRQDESRHSTAGHMAAMAQKQKGGWMVLVVGLVAVVAMALIFILPGRGLDGRISRALSDTEVREIASDVGQRGAVTLSDGTQATMGPFTRFVIAPDFTTILRALKIEGTSTFTVAKMEALPFMVRAGKATITATGTTFEVSAYPEEAVTIRVRTGSVSVRVGKDERSLNAGESLRVSADGDMTAPTAQQLESALGWIGGQLVIDDLPIRNVLTLFKRWYSLDVAPPEAALLDRRVSIRVGLDSTRAAMTALEQSASVLFDSNGKKWILRDVAKK